MNSNDYLYSHQLPLIGEIEKFVDENQLKEYPIVISQYMEDTVLGCNTRAQRTGIRMGMHLEAVPYFCRDVKLLYINSIGEVHFK